MATLVSTQAGSTVPARRAESGVYPIKGTYALAAALAASDVIQMVKVPAGATVLDGYVQLPDLDSNGSPTINIECGDGSDPDRFIDGTTGGQAAGLLRFNSLLFPHTYTAEDTVDLVATAGPATGATSGTITLVVFVSMDP